jgi:hypothetical protein
MWISKKMFYQLRPAIISHGFEGNFLNLDNIVISQQQQKPQNVDIHTNNYFTNNNNTSKSNNNSNNINDNNNNSNNNNNNKLHRMMNIHSNYSNPKKLLNSFVWDGCRDYSSMLCVPNTIHFWQNIPNGGIEACRKYNNSLLREATELLKKEWGIEEEEFVSSFDMRKDSPMSLVYF